MNNKGLFAIASILGVVIIVLIIFNALWADDAAYKRALSGNTLDDYVAFVDRYPDSDFANAARDSIESKRYQHVLSARTISMCKSYLEKHQKHKAEIMLLYDDLSYEDALSKDDVEEYYAYLNTHPEGQHVTDIRDRIDSKDKEFYSSYINVADSKLSRLRIDEYLRIFPDGKYRLKAREKYLILADNDDYASAKTSNTRYAWEKYLEKHPRGKYVSYAKARVQEFKDLEFYQNYSLANGAQPYSSYYGSNYSYDYGRPSVTVNASSTSDVIVIIRYNNSNGSVAGHTYVKKGCSSTIYLLPNRYYQVFFYYGKGWYPKKQMKGGVRGGFLLAEDFDKDGESVYMKKGQTLTYTLTTQINGNFSTTNSSENEMF